MLALLLAPHVLPGFPSLATASSQTARLGGPTVPGTEAGSWTLSLGGR
jgi:hypothetical protein